MKSIKSLWLVSLLSIVLILAACSSESGGNETTEDDTGKDPEDNSEEIVLNMASWRTEDVAQYNKIIEKFNEKHPNIKINFNPTKTTEYNTVLNTALQA